MISNRTLIVAYAVLLILHLIFIIIYTFSASSLRLGPYLLFATAAAIPLVLLGLRGLRSRLRE